MPRITQKGQVTIPQHIRSHLSIACGDEIDFKLVAGNVVVEKKAVSTQNLKKYVGYLSHLKGKDSDEIVSELRGDADDHRH